MSARLHRAAALLAVAALGCSDPLGPTSVAGVYVLRHVGGAPLPAMLFTNESVTVHAIADTLRFGADGRGTHSAVSETEHAFDGSRSERQHTETAFGFRIVGRNIEISYFCPPNANCVAPPHRIARREGDDLRIVGTPNLPMRAPLHYERVSATP